MDIGGIMPDPRDKFANECAGIAAHEVDVVVNNVILDELAIVRTLDCIDEFTDHEPTRKTYYNSMVKLLNYKLRDMIGTRISTQK